jgi:xylan 1,4-beta-xylosidase
MASNLLIPGFNPDPSIVRVEDDYYLVTSSFEYRPALPVYHSRDLVEFDLVGHVVDRPGMLADGVRTGGGLWAPTIRFHDSRFHVIVTDAMGRGNLLFTAEDPRAWSEPTPLADVKGIDPDLAWDDDGTCYVTFSGLHLEPPRDHRGIQQMQVDLETGRPIEEPRAMWSGTGLMFPEAPHLYHIGDWWYLMIAEGGTERGHAVSIARSESPTGPFVGCPTNPILSARSTIRPVQNTGHGDLVVAPDGTWRMVLLGVRTAGATRAFSPLGRESFITTVDWVDGWPVVDPVELGDDVPAPSFSDDFDAATLGLEWVGVRRLPGEVSSISDGVLYLSGEGRTMDDLAPAFVGRRQRRLDARISTSVVSRGGVGGLTIRYDEEHHYDLEIDGWDLVTRARLAGISHETRMPLPPGSVVLFAEMRRPEGDVVMTSDMITLGFEFEGLRHELESFDGRYLTAETTCSFTGRVAGMYCVAGELGFDWYREEAVGGSV